MDEKKKDRLEIRIKPSLKERIKSISSNISEYITSLIETDLNKKNQ